MTKATFWAWFTNSETVLYARAQVLFGSLFGVLLVVWSVVQGTDLSALIEPKWVAVVAIANGVISELLRRQGTVVVAGHLIPKDLAPAAILNPGDPAEGVK